MKAAEIKNLHRDVDTFTRGYIVCALWSTNDESDPSGGGGEPMDKNYSWTAIAPETLQTMLDDCAKFQAENDLTGYPSEQAGQDFWLTRAGHGCGFWENDFGTEEQCDKLTEVCKRFGEFYLYVGDDGKIYGH